MKSKIIYIYTPLHYFYPWNKIHIGTQFKKVDGKTYPVREKHFFAWKVFWHDVKTFWRWKCLRYREIVLHQNWWE